MLVLVLALLLVLGLLGLLGASDFVLSFQQCQDSVTLDNLEHNHLTLWGTFMTMLALLTQALGWTMLLSQDFQVHSHIPGIVDDWSTINSRYRDEQNHWCWSFRVRMDYLERMQRRNTTKGKVETGWKAWKRF